MLSWRLSGRLGCLRRRWIVALLSGCWRRLEVLVLSWVQVSVMLSWKVAEGEYRLEWKEVELDKGNQQSVVVARSSEPTRIELSRHDI